MKNSEYLIDISQPPIGPPCIIKRQGWFSFKETKESIEQTKRWNIYIKKYIELLSDKNEKIR